MPPHQDVIAQPCSGTTFRDVRFGWQKGEAKRKAREHDVGEARGQHQMGLKSENRIINDRQEDGKATFRQPNQGEHSQCGGYNGWYFLAFVRATPYLSMR